MRTLIILFVFLSFNIHAQQKSQAFELESDSYNFGKIKEEGGNVEHVFVIKNTGKTPLIIQEVTSTCGCTVPEWSKQPIVPGNKGFIKAIFDPKGRPHAFSKEILVRTNVEKTPIILKISGEVIPKKLTIEEQYTRKAGDLRFKSMLKSFGQIRKETTVTDTIFVYNSGANIVALGFENIPNFLNIKFEPKQLQSKKTGYILITLNGKQTEKTGALNEELKLTSNGELIQNGIIRINAVIEDN